MWFKIDPRSAIRTRSTIAPINPRGDCRGSSKRSKNNCSTMLNFKDYARYIDSQIGNAWTSDVFSVRNLDDLLPHFVRESLLTHRQWTFSSCGNRMTVYPRMGFFSEVRHGRHLIPI